jgi:hypothetical protein
MYFGQYFDMGAAYLLSKAGFPLASHTETHHLVLELVVASSCQTSDKGWSLLPERGLRCSSPNRLEWAAQH